MSIFYSAFTKIRAHKILKIFYNSYSAGYNIKLDDGDVISSFKFFTINQLTDLLDSDNRSHIKDAVGKLIKDGFLEEVHVWNSQKLAPSDKPHKVKDEGIVAYKEGFYTKAIMKLVLAYAVAICAILTILWYIVTLLVR